MNLLTPFIILIERHALHRLWLTWRSPLVLVLMLTLALANPAAHAQTASSKIARDLQPALTATTTPTINWAKDINGVRYVKVLIVSNSDDAALTALRSAVMAAGGSIYYRYSSVLALAALLPANQVSTIAARSDVQSISPNRLMTRSASTIESVTGTAAIRTTGTTNYSSITGATGKGIGIAVLDSGISWQHAEFLDDGGASRVRESISFTKVGDAVRAGVTDWKAGIDVSGVLYPGSPTMTTYLGNIQNGFAPKADRYGHGSHVAAVAAGRGTYQAVDTTGIAPNANLFDVRVLDDNGYGQLSDVLAGIDWVIYYGKFKNIRIINLSLGADSTESYQTDPLARAVRSAVAQGIVVVVAGGNFGINTVGKEAYGTVSSPGHEPSVITVGSVNTKGTTSRGDDVVNNFSSRGPTRGSLLDASGVRQYDNVLKPDLVAPGNKIVSALGEDTAAAGGAWNLLATRYPALAQVSGVSQAQDKALMQLSGTSIAAPVVSGAVALMLEANNGLTPGLVKAILQYTAQTLPNANLAQQGAGALNIDGAVRLAGAIRNDMAQRITAGGTITAGESLLWWSGATLPTPSSVINGETVPWGPPRLRRRQPRRHWRCPVQAVATGVRPAPALGAQRRQTTHRALLAQHQQRVPDGCDVRLSSQHHAADRRCGVAGRTSRHLVAGGQDGRVPALGQAVIVDQQWQDVDAGHRAEPGPGAQRRPGPQRRTGPERRPGTQRGGYHQPDELTREDGHRRALISLTPAAKVRT